MGWKFWERKGDSAASGPSEKIKLPTPKDMPTQIGQYLVVQKKLDPDYVWELQCALRPHIQTKTSFDFRIFSNSSAQKADVKVANYDTLDDHPELILFEGNFDKSANQIEIRDQEKPVPQRQ